MNEAGNQPLIRIVDLAVSFDTGGNQVRAVNGVDLSIYPQQTVSAKPRR